MVFHAIGRIRCVLQHKQRLFVNILWHEKPIASSLDDSSPTAAISGLQAIQNRGPENTLEVHSKGSLSQLNGPAKGADLSFEFLHWKKHVIFETAALFFFNKVKHIHIFLRTRPLGCCQEVNKGFERFSKQVITFITHWSEPFAKKNWDIPKPWGQDPPNNKKSSTPRKA